MSLEMLLAQFDGVIETAEDVEKLNAAILDWAVRGKLIAHNSFRQTAENIIQESAAEQKKLYKEKRIPKPAKVSGIKSSEIPFPLPDGWAWTRAMNICAYIQRGKSPKYSEIEKYPVISQKCVQWSGFDISRARFIDPKSLSKYQNYRFLQDGDLLWNSTGVGTLGRITVYRAHLNPYELAVADSHVTILRPTSKVNSDYLNLWFSSPFVQDRIDNKSSGTTKQTELNTSTVQEHLVAFPPCEVQKRIVARVDELLAQTQQLAAELQQANTQRRQVFTSMTHHLTHANGAGPAATWPLLATNFDRLLASVETVDELKQAILQLAVQGRLVPQDPNDEPASVLLERIAAERWKRIKEGEIRKTKGKAPDSDKLSETILPAGWVLCSLSDIILYLQTGPFGSNLHKSDYVPEGIPVINPSDMHDGRIIRSGAKMVGPETLERLSSYKLSNGDVVMARRGEMGRCGAVTEEEDGWLCGTGSLILRLTNHTYQPYMIMLIQSESTREYLRDGSVGATMSNLNQRVLLKMPVALPPFQEQKRIIAKVDELLALCDRLAGQLTFTHAAREHLLDSLLEQAS